MHDNAIRCRYINESATNNHGMFLSLIKSSRKKSSRKKKQKYTIIYACNAEIEKS